MKIKILKDSGKPLILVFLGYSFIPECLKSLETGEFDLAVIYDYKSLDFDAEFKNSLKGREIYLIAWSMGVWAANLVLNGVVVKKSIAINGTPLGIDDKFGIPREIFQKSIDEFDFENFKKICFLKELGRVDFGFSEYPKLELESIFSNANSQVQNTIEWDVAIISKKDFIFPPKACDEYFLCRKIHINAPHFVFFSFKSFGEILEV